MLARKLFLSALAIPALALGVAVAVDPKNPKAELVVPADVDFDPYDQSKVPLEVEPPADFKGKKIVIVAGSKSHGPGDHEFFAGTAILMNLLKQTPGVWPVMARDGWPKNEKIFDGAAAILFYMDGRGGHPVVQKDRLKMLQQSMDKGVRLGEPALRRGLRTTPRRDRRRVDGRVLRPPHFHEPALGCELPGVYRKHPITNGVKPFTIRDEWYYNMHWIGDVLDVAEAKNVTPILQSPPAGQLAWHRRREEVPGPRRNRGVGL